MIFDGKALAKEIEQDLIYKVRNLPRGKAGLLTKPKIVSILVGNDPASVLYTKLKGEAAERVGIEFEAVRVQQADQITAEIKKRADATGIMIQLPIQGLRGQTLKGVVSAIPLEKDIDGLRWKESGVMPATVRAVITILERIALNQKFEIRNKKIVVWGARGAVGEPLVSFLRERGAEVVEIEIETENPEEISQQGEIVISCVGKPGVVSTQAIAKGSIVVDVGITKSESGVAGDMGEGVYEKARVAVPVPGGVGPVTVISLLLNTVELDEKGTLA